MSQRVAEIPPIVATGEPEGCRRLSQDYERFPETSQTASSLCPILYL
ncbi:hypothetical protein [Anabaena azotica]|uniref:CpcA n=1 Tax=Anabaena azotica FACHB-119 TaxID=947527 RepID=A0ABR8DC73_9NOST|nr:hypothetical protein [Anabaena azotica FACHB-119]